MTEHSRFGGSSASRWMSCPGSIGLTERSRASGDIPAESASSEYASEGTRAHLLLSECLEGGQDAYERPELADDADMMVHVQSALDAFRRLGRGTRFIETRVYPIADRADVFGTVDFALLLDGVLSVVDFKYGKGIRVSPEDNTQLKFYALGLLLALPASAVHTVRPGIHQPRTSGREIQWGTALTADDLRGWGEALARAVGEAETPGAPLSPGDHCRWCPAKSMCPAQSALLFDSFGTAAPPAKLSDEEIGARLQQAVVLRDYIRELEAIVYARLKAGSTIPGWKLVRRKTNRVWKEGAEKVLVDTAGDAAYNKTLLSPAAAEKLPGGKAVVKEWAYMPEGGLTLAPETDSREKQPGGAAAMFAEFLKPKGV